MIAMDFMPHFSRMPLTHQIGYAAFGFFAVVYFMFQKKMFSKANTLVISKFLFYPTFPITVMMRIGNYWNVVDKTVILGCAPMAFLGHPAAFHGMGVRGVVNCCAEYEGPKAAYEAMGITQLRIPSVDHYEADAGLLEEAVAFIQGYADRGEKVYVHCKAGHGRAAAVALAWLISQNKQIAVKDLNMLLGSKRKVRKTLYQQANINDFCTRLSQNNDKNKPVAGASDGSTDGRME